MRTSTPSPQRRSLRVTITLWVTGLALLGLLATGVVTGVAGMSAIRERIDESLAREIGEFRELAARHDGSDIEHLLRQSMEENVPDEHETFLAFLPDATLVPVEGAPDLANSVPFRRHVLSFSTPSYATFNSPDDGEVRVAVMPVDGVDEWGEPQRAHFVVVYFVAKELSELQEVVWYYLGGSVLVTLAIAAAAWLASSSVLAPLRLLRDTARRISGSDVTERIQVSGTDEVAELTRTVNSMLDRLQDALDSQRNMLDDVGHELRTPITVVRGHLELMDPADPDDVQTSKEVALDELDRMNTLVTDVLTLAKSRRPDFLTPARINLVDVVTDVIDRAQVMSVHHTFTAVVLDETYILGDRQRLVQALMQLIDNAMAVSPPSSLITLGCDRLGASARLWVSDTGPGIPPEEQDKVFDRNHRGTTSYEGTGIGLAIVSAIAAAHDGRARIARTGEDGTTMLIELPALREA